MSDPSTAIGAGTAAIGESSIAFGVRPTATPAPPAQAPAEAPAVKETDWKAEARKWEERAKANNSAAERLAEIEEASKSAEQKAAERLATAEKAAAAAEAKVIRRDIALEHKLTAEDAALLDTITDETTLRALAARLTPSDEPSGARAPKPDRNQGGTTGSAATLGDQFAGFFNKQLGG